jgi:hypothetical protein
MAEVTIVVKASREVSVDPETAWSLLGSAAVWSLRPGHFAFDAAAVGSEPIRCLLRATSKGVQHGVLTVGGEQPGVEATWAAVGGSWEVTFSARPHRGGAVAAASVRSASDRGRAYYLKRNWDRVVGVWLARACEVLEGRQPWPASMPPEVSRACTRPALEATQSASASVLIAAPPSRVWELVWSPATAAREPGVVAYGHVPGTPSQEAGEMQYFVSRRGDGRLRVRTVLVRDVAYQRSAVTQAVLPPHVRTDYLLVAEGDASRLELTVRWAEAAFADEPGLVRANMTESVRSAADIYKSAVEESDRTA